MLPNNELKYQSNTTLWKNNLGHFGQGLNVCKAFHSTEVIYFQIFYARSSVIVLRNLPPWNHFSMSSHLSYFAVRYKLYVYA